MTAEDVPGFVSAAPISVPANQPVGRFYDGGRGISAFRGAPPAPPRTPEDWIGSTVSVRGEKDSGRSRLPDGRLLSDAIAADPGSWLGHAHVRRHGSDPMLLVKLLDAGQRLPIHAHPDGAFAAQHVHSAHGKAEAWYILEPGTVYLGLREPLDRADLLQLVQDQDTARMLSLMHAVKVEPHDTVFVPPGLLHAIGAGILLLEVQEPEDLSILLEWKGFDLDGATDGHLGLGFDVALDAVETTHRTRVEIRSLVRRNQVSGPVLDPESSRYFRLDRMPSGETFPAGFAIVVALSGSTSIELSGGAIMQLQRGMTVILPFAAGDVTLHGDGAVLIARPPAP